MKRKHISGQDFTLQRKETENELKKKRRKLFSEIRAILLVVFAAAVLGYAFITFCMQTVVVRGPSMDPTLIDGETVVINKLAYVFGSVERGDIVAIRPMGSDEYFDIKRVIGLPGETICIRDGRIYINGEPLEDPYLTEEITVIGVAEKEVLIDEDSIFVIGDNRNHSIIRF